MKGQLSIDGDELTGHVALFPGLPPVEWPETEPLHFGDVIVVEVRYKVGYVKDGAPLDTRGIPKETIKRLYETSLDKSSVKVSAVLVAKRAREEGAA